MAGNDSNPIPADNRAGGAPFRYEFLADRHRVHATYNGLWSEQNVPDALSAFRQVLEKASAGGKPFTLLDDFSGYQVQSPQVADMANEFEAVMRSYPIRRNAMVIPNAQIRMQVRRTLTDFRLSQIFATYEEADKWLAAVEREL